MVGREAITTDALAEIERSMRPIDRLEFDCLTGGREPGATLRMMVDRARRSRAAYFDGRLIAIYGVSGQTLLSDVGTPWLLATREVERPEVRRAFIAGTRDEMAWMASGFVRLWNVVAAENKVAIRWLQWMGFRFDHEPVEIAGHMFRPFVMELS